MKEREDIFPLMAQSRTIGILSGLAAAALWGGMYVVSKVLLDIIPPFTLLSLRLVLGVAVLCVPLARRGKLGLTRRQVMMVLGIGLVGYGISLGFQFTGTRLSTASNGALVTSATPAFVLLFAAILLAERITLRRLAALLLATLGVLAIIDPRGADLSGGLFLGNLCLVAAAVTWALYSVLVRRATRSLAVLPVTVIAFCGGLFISLPAAAFELNFIPLRSVNTLVILGVLYLGVLSTAVAMYLWNRAFALLEAGTASLTFFAQPLVGATLGTLFLGEKWTPLFVLGGVLIGIGLWLSARETG